MDLELRTLPSTSPLKKTIALPKRERTTGSCGRRAGREWTRWLALL